MKSYWTRRMCLRTDQLYPYSITSSVETVLWWQVEKIRTCLLCCFSNALFQLHQYLRVLICVLIVEGYILWGLGVVICFLKKNTSGDLPICLISFLLLVALGSHFKGFFFAAQREGNYFSQCEGWGPYAISFLQLLGVQTKRGSRMTHDEDCKNWQKCNSTGCLYLKQLFL